MDFPIKLRLDYDRFLIKKPTKENSPNPNIELGSGTDGLFCGFKRAIQALLLPFSNSHLEKNQIKLSYLNRELVGCRVLPIFRGSTT
jgi:hypothetical protein